MRIMEGVEWLGDFSFLGSSSSQSTHTPLKSIVFILNHWSLLNPKVWDSRAYPWAQRPIMSFSISRLHDLE